MLRRPSRSLPGMVTVVVAVAIAGLVGACSAIAEEIDSSISAPRAETTVEGDASVGALLPVPASPSQPLRVGVASETVAREAVQLTDLASEERMQISARAGIEEIEEYDPWEPYNEAVFSFNYKVFDRYLLKPLATVWDKVVPDPVQESLANAFDNIGMPRRVVNNLLQAKFIGAGRELARFLVNTTIGIAGFFDIAKTAGLEKSDRDTGQTLGVYGVGPGPYLILPILPPLTVRDGIGYVADLALDPLNYVFPLAASVGRRGGEIVNDRSQNLEFFQSVEEHTLDLYTAVRNAYLQRRQKAIKE